MTKHYFIAASFLMLCSTSAYGGYKHLGAAHGLAGDANEAPQQAVNDSDDAEPNATESDVNLADTVVGEQEGAGAPQAAEALEDFVVYASNKQ